MARSALTHEYRVPPESVSRDDYRDQLVDIYLQSRFPEDSLPVIHPDDRQRLEDEFRSSLSLGDIFEVEIRNERRFMEQIGVSNEAANWGFFPDRYPNYIRSNADGWTFTLNSLPYFGIHNVVYKGDDPYPTPRDEQTPEVLIYTPTPIPTPSPQPPSPPPSPNLPRPTRPPR